MSRNYTIGTGYWSCAEDSQQKREFADLWYQVNAAPQSARVVVLDNSEAGDAMAYPGYEVVRAHANLGDMPKAWGIKDSKLSPYVNGWGMSWILPALVAYSNKTDFIYIEQDCLCFGDWLGSIRRTAEAANKLMLFGEGWSGTLVEQSLFWIAWEFIPRAVREWLELPGDGQMLSEHKFHAMWKKLPNALGTHIVGPGRNRPIPATGTMSVQKLKPDELALVRQQRGLRVMRQGFIDLALDPGPDGRGDSQWGWYEPFKDWMAGRTILDVGTGISKIKERLAEWGWGATVITHEACPDLPADVHGDLSALGSKLYDTVTCFDVIEHVKDYGKLVWNMARIAKKNVIITTPGYEITGCRNPWHWHEFYPDELMQLVESTGMRFVRAYAQEWVSYPDKPGTWRQFSEEELKKNPKVHPIAICYEHPQ